jgi:putative transposase
MKFWRGGGRGNSTPRSGNDLVRLLLKGSMAYGYRTNLWTTARIAGLVEQEFGVSYHRDHIGRLMHGLGWSVQKPERRALEAGGVAAHKKTPRGWAPT